MKVDIKNLSVSYMDQNHALLALDQVDISLEPGQVTCLVGESGSGKTTLGKAVMGLLPENAQANGSVLLGGKDILGAGEAELNALRWSQMAMVFQNGVDNLNPVHRLLNQVAEPLIQKTACSAREAKEKALQALADMGIDPDQAQRFPHELSGGQVQRGLLAMALVLDPPVLILDEPTAALDAMTKRFVAWVIQDLKKRGHSILLITHDLDLAGQIGDEIAVLYLGKVMEHLPGRDLRYHPRHPYTLALSRSFPGMEAVRDLGGIRGDAFYRMVHSHAPGEDQAHSHIHVATPQAVHEDGHAPPQGCLFQPRCTQALPYCRQGEVPLIGSGGHRVRCLRGGIADMLSLQGVAKSYGKVRALQPTDLTLKAGEFFCLVGETGSGKTTLAMIAAGALKHDQGNRSFDGRDMDHLIKHGYRSLAHRIGVIYQNPAEAVSHRLSVFDIVAEPLRIQDRGMPKDEVRSRVLGALHDVHLSTSPEFLKRHPHELNMGAIQRLCMARALVHGPSLMIADEPTSSLDPSVQAKVLKMLLDLQLEKGLTMLFVTHDIGLARKVGDRIGVMLAGRLLEMGPAAQVINHPGHPYTRMLLESARQLGEIAPSPPSGQNGADSACPFFHRCGQSSQDCREPMSAPAKLADGGHWAWCRHPLGQDG